ncbi:MULTISPECIES: NAD(P)/FAD-dependent oxidoreductase [Lysinibacillus]|uniref:NAD(P)/FAD-dependent oxidoreductase n=1 Tax=Lysinibacillus antri TaxID=2498145 RepID=A0A3S0P6Z8_9BACI|nr:MULTISPECIES: NAD(P)/FAD-dependent oxidoreductase [Lysinibacillus]RUL50500.1 NAD(P)/FAD-dependent oxidoreductase [Lysinibacillus antri]TSI07698.1 NAD(P)/FAD-dependent oxidoreductase [Lysinibacillus sp. BW-2-10]
MTIKQYDAVVIGAGFAGLYMLHKLRERGLSVRVIEAADGVGGVWYWSRYPGAKCDSDSIFYNFTFSEELYKKWSWKDRYASQPEILEYLNFVADELDLRPDIQFSTRVKEASFNNDIKHWEIYTDTDETLIAKYFISGVGCLSTTNVPPFEGSETFKGEQYHTGRWPHEKVDFTGKRVVVIGNGSSGVQAMPEIAKEAKELTLLMRTPHYVAEARNHPLSKEDQEKAIQNYEDIRDSFSTTPGGIRMFTTGKSATEFTEEQQKETLEHVWTTGGLALGSVYPDVGVNKETNYVISQFVRDKIDEIVEDPEKAKMLHPDYYITTKRLIIGTNFYEIFNEDHVNLLSLKDNPIERIVENGVALRDGIIECDVIVYATGYEAMTGSLLKIDIQGRDGQSIQDKWGDGRDVKTYLGLTMENFPNFFMITGPQSPSVLTNMPSAIEQHVDWIDRCIEYLEDNNLQTIEAQKISEMKWGKQCDDLANSTLFPHTNSWYTGANIDGEQRGFVIYVGGLNNYKKICDQVADNNYEGFSFEKAHANVVIQ